jgi:two-component system, LytTR family, response regulator
MSADASLRVLLVDDEELARRVLREYLSRHENIEIVGECENGYEAVRAVTETKPDLLFLDVQMPKLDGFEVLELLDRRVAVIFVTAFDEHAIRAFEVHAVDYLLKPVAEERLARALARVRERAVGGGVSPTQLAADAKPDTPKPADRLLVRDGTKVHVIQAHQLDYAVARDDYVELHAGGREFLKHQTLSDLEGQLDPDRFVRTHRSYLVNVERIAKIEPYAKDSRIAILQDGTQIPLSRTGYARIRERS